MLSRWLRVLVVAPVVLFVFGAILLSCSGSSGSGTNATATPGFSLDVITISTGAPPSPTFTPIPPSKTPKKTPSATLTPRPAATSTTITSIGPSGVPTGGTVAFNAIAKFDKKTRTKYGDITFGPATLWTSTDNSILIAPPSGDMGGVYTTGFAGCVCILASASGVSSQFVGVGVYQDVDTCPLCPTPFANTDRHAES